MNDLLLLAMSLGASVCAALLVLRVVVYRQATAERVAHRLVFPRDVTPEAVTSFVRSLSGLLPPYWRRLWVWPHVVFEVRADANGIEHRLLAPSRQAEYVLGQLRAAVPGVRIEAEPFMPTTVRLAGGLVQSAKLRELRVDDPAAASRAIMAALQPLATGERIVCQWVIAPTVAKPVREHVDDARFVPLASRSWRILLPGQLPSKDDVREARKKLQEPVFSAVARIGAQASASRARRLIGRVTSSFHIVNASGSQLRRRFIESFVTRRRIEGALPPVAAYGLLLNARELVALLALPISSPTIPGLRLGACRQLPPSPAISSVGRVLAEANAPGAERPLAVSAVDSLGHIHLCGPTGTGKSTVMLNQFVEDMRAGNGGALFDPKGDLADDVLDRTRRDDVIVFDPTDVERPVGLTLFSSAEHERELVARNFVGVMQRIWASSWGPRTADVISSAVLTLCRLPGMTPCEIPVILSDDAWRRRAIAGLDDALGLSSFWAWYDALSPAERASVIGPVMNKIRAFLLWPTIRNSLAQAEPRFTLDEVVREGKILIVRLPKGTLGEDTSALLGSLIFSALWSAVQRRASVPAAQRRPFFCFLDEVQDFLNMPTPVADVLAQARGLGLSLTVAHQNLAQLPAPTRAAVLANCRTKMFFQASASDAAVLAKEFAPYLDASDLMGLAAREVAMRINVGAEVSPPVTGRTLPPSPSLGNAGRVRTLSRERYGRPRAEIEAAIKARHATPDVGGAVGGRRRR